MSDMKKINLSELSGTYEPIPDGEYEVKLTNVEPSQDKNGDGMLIVTFTVTKGPHKGAEVKQWFLLAVRETKTGKLACRGLSQMAAIFKAIGVPESRYSVLDPDRLAAGRLLQDLVRGKTLEAYVAQELNEKDGKSYTRLKITGLAGVTSREEHDEDEGE